MKNKPLLKYKSKNKVQQRLWNKLATENFVMEFRKKIKKNSTVIQKVEFVFHPTEGYAHPHYYYNSSEHDRELIEKLILDSASSYLD